VFGSRSSPMFGVGGQIRFKGRLAIEGSVERFEKTGERVFVSDGEVFKLGIADTVRIMPVAITAIFREPRQRFTPYFGIGAGRYSFKETSDFADPAENTDARFTSYQAVIGLEFGSPRSVFKPAVEVVFTSVPKALGDSGASKAFEETNLGGVQIRVKVLAGR
jgi:hypothetical protein